LHDRAVNDKDGYVRGAAVAALAQHYRTDPQTLPLLHDRAVNDKSPSVVDQDYSWMNYMREVALETIAKQWPEHPETVLLLHERAENDPTPWLRERARQLAAALEASK
jgi:hypothetical protein